VLPCSALRHRLVHRHEVFVTTRICCISTQCFSKSLARGVTNDDLLNADRTTTELHLLDQGRTHGGGGGLPACNPYHTSKNRSLKNTDSVDIMISKVLRDYPSAEISH
jgi:hypothetical protein